jgi:hypothetical protein
LNNHGTYNIISHLQKHAQEAFIASDHRLTNSRYRKKRSVVLIQPIITSPTKQNYQKRSQTEVNQAPSHVIESQNSPQLGRVVTPAARSAARPRVPARARNLSPRNLSQGDFLDMGSASHAIASSNPNLRMMNKVIHQSMGKSMKYKDIMKHPTLGPPYTKGVGN